MKYTLNPVTQDEERPFGFRWSIERDGAVIVEGSSLFRDVACETFIAAVNLIARYGK